MKTALQNEEETYLALFGEDCCCGTVETASKEKELAELNDAICLCEDILHDCIDRNDKEEVSYWRKLLQKNKMQKREILNS